MLKLFCLFCFVSILFYFLFFKNMILLCFQYFLFIFLFGFCFVFCFSALVFLMRMMGHHFKAPFQLLLEKYGEHKSLP